MDKITKRQMNSLNNYIIVVCLATLIGIVLFKKSMTCSCKEVTSAQHIRVVKI
jgi:hypothetical protein